MVAPISCKNSAYFICVMVSYRQGGHILLRFSAILLPLLMPLSAFHPHILSPLTLSPRMALTDDDNENSRPPIIDLLGCFVFISGFWISIELIFTLTHITASLAVLYFSRHEHPQTPLCAWLVGYTFGCFASLPFYYWCFFHCNQDTERGGVQPNWAFAHANFVSGKSTYVTKATVNRTGRLPIWIKAKLSNLKYQMAKAQCFSANMRLVKDKKLHHHQQHLHRKHEAFHMHESMPEI